MQRRKTKHRTAILDLFQRSHVITAKVISEAYPDMDVSTIYRNLLRMVEDGVIRELHFQKDIASYELASDEHQHFVCANCDKAIPFEVDVATLRKLLPKECTVETAEIQLRGTCGTC